ncbi:MAG: hypothetical protein WCG84_00540 [Candidatus Moraniibacteriota bacterium]
MNDISQQEQLVIQWLKSNLEVIRLPDDLYCQTREVFQTRLERMLNELLENQEITDDQSYLISAMVGEIGNNSFDHNVGNWRDIMGIFFSYSFAEGKFQAVLADRGQGVLKTLRQVRPSLANDRDALLAAFTEKLSGRAPENRGNGLKFVRTGVNSNHFHLTFLSGNARAEINDVMEITENKEDGVLGCLAILSL